MISTFDDIVWPDVGDLAKLISACQYCVAHSNTAKNTTLSKESVFFTTTVFGLNDESGCIVKLKEFLLALDNIQQYLLLIPFVPYSTRCTRWIILLQLLLLIPKSVTAINSKAYTGSSVLVQVLDIVQSICLDVELLWAIALCGDGLVTERDSNYWKSPSIRGKIVTSITAAFPSFSRASFNSISNISRVNRLCDFLISVACYRCVGLNDTLFQHHIHEERHDKLLLVSAKEIQRGFFEYLLFDPNDQVWKQAASLLHHFYDDNRGKSKEIMDMVNSSVDWKDAKQTLILNVSIFNSILQDCN